MSTTGNTYRLYQQRLIQKRKTLGYSLQTLAKRSGVSEAIITKIELGQVLPSIDIASRIAEGLGFSLSDMFLVEKKDNVIFHPSSRQFTIVNNGHHKKIISPPIKSACIEMHHDHLDKSEALIDVVHLDSDKYIMALDHELHIEVKDIEYALNKNDCLYIDKGNKHSIRNKSEFQVSFLSTIHRKTHS